MFHELVIIFSTSKNWFLNVFQVRLNNLSKYNVTSIKYSKYYGIDQYEINALIEHFNISSEKFVKIKGWYNGYKSNIGTTEEPIFIDKYNIHYFYYIFTSFHFTLYKENKFQIKNECLIVEMFLN